MNHPPYKLSLMLKTMKENYVSMLRFFLPLVILLICSTKLRFSNLPIGVGEIVLAIFILSNCIALGIYILGPQNFLILLTIFWLVVFFTLCVGALFSLSLVHFNPSVGMREVLALGFVAGFTLTLVAINNRLIIPQEQLIWFVRCACFLICLMFIIANAYWWSVSDHFWYSKRVRFSGLSDNPNQFALLLSSVPFLIMYHWKISKFRFNAA